MQTIMNRPRSTNEPLTDVASGALWGRLWGTSRFLTTATLLHIVLIGVALIGNVFDPRLVLNEPAWIKPFKFALSVAIYCGTITWMVSFVRRPRWLKQIILVGTGTILTIELGWVVLQAARGVRSHFNFTTQFDAVSFQMMGLLIMTLWVLNLILVVLLLVQRFNRPLFKWSLVWGLTIAILGGLTGLAMTEQTTAAQQAVWDAGAVPAFEGGHTFGAEDGGPGLPLLGWSTTAGDVRVAHFIGLHGLQILPLLGFAINRFYGRLSEGRRLALLFLCGTGYLGLVATTFQQAIRGYSIVSFDSLTVFLAIGLVGIVWAGSRAVIRLDDWPN